MKNCLCPKCGKQTEVALSTITRRWLARGYKFEGWVYFVKCPSCYHNIEVKYPDLPFRVKLHFWFKR